MNLRSFGLAPTLAALLLASLGIPALPAQQLDSAAVIQRVDAAVKARTENVAEYSVTEHYSVFRNHDETHPAAEMTVKTLYKRESGKSYTILSESGSEILRNHLLHPLLENEKRVNVPGTREHSFFTSANYEMKLKPGGVQQLDGRECVQLAITPRRKATNMIAGTLWVDAQDGSVVRIEGTATQSPSILTGPAQVARQYARMSGYAMATHARAESNSFLLGQTVVTIDYKDYHMEIHP